MPRLDAGTAKQWAEGELQRQLAGNYSGLDLTPAQRDLIIQQSLPLYESDWQASEQGNASIASALDNYFQQSQTPDKLYAKQQAEYQKNAPQYYDSVNQQFQNLYGRTATQDELSHFGSLLSSKQIDPYQLQQFLQQQVEYVDKQNANFRKGLAGELEGYDKQYFDQSVLPQLQDTFAKQGRSFDSSSFAQAATNSAQQQNVSRQQYLAQLAASQYGNNQANARSDYENYVNQLYGRENAGYGRTYALQDAATKRAQDLQDFQLQQNAYNSYLAKYGKRSNTGLGGLIGGIVGAGAGAYFGKGNPQAIQAGYGVGSGLGSAGQGAFGGGSY